MLRAQMADILAMLASQERAAAQAVEAARTEGYEQRAAEESRVPPPRVPGERHLRIVGCAPVAAAAGRALLRHKVALSVVAAGALVAAAVPAWHTAEFRVAGQKMGFSHVESGPLVRSSYHASNAVA